MSHTLRALGVVIALLTLAPPAAAQYGGGGNPPVSGAAGHPGRATLSARTARPGDSIQVSVPAGSFAAGTSASLRFVRVRDRSAVVTLATAVVKSDGSVSFTFLVPVTPSGVYLVIVEGTGANAKPLAFVAPLVVRAPLSAAGRQEVLRAAGSRSPEPSLGVGPVVAAPRAAAAAGERPLLPMVQALQGTLTAPQEAAAVDAVVAGEARVVLGDAGLAVVEVGGRKASDHSGDGSGGQGDPFPGVVTGALAVLLAGCGLFALRRRNARRSA